MGSLHFWAQNASNDELIAAAQADPSNDSVAMNEMVRRFEGKAVKIASGLTGDVHARQDAANAARLGVMMAVRAHKQGTHGFPSYADLTMRGEAGRALGRASFGRNEIVVECEAPVWHKVPAATSQSVSLLESDLGLLLKDLTRDQRHLVLARYAEGYGVSEIASGLGTSVSAVSQRFNTIHKAVRERAVAGGVRAA